MPILKKGSPVPFDCVCLTYEEYNELKETKNKHEYNKKVMQTIKKVFNDKHRTSEEKLKQLLPPDQGFQKLKKHDTKLAEVV